MALPDGLLDAVKNYLDITWTTTDAENAKLTGILWRGMRYLDGVAGEALDYTEEDAPRGLLFDYARYARSNALDEYAVNYRHELLGLQIARQAIRKMADDAVAGGGGT